MKTSTPDPAALRIPSEWSRQYRKLQSLRDDIVADRAGQMDEISDRLESLGTDDADSGTDEFDHNLALAILAHEDDALFEVDSAIERILNGTYGVCEVTGEAIPEARLRVVPWTRYTKATLERIERKQAELHPHLASASSIPGPPPGGLASAPEPEEISTETTRLKKRDRIREFARETGFDVTPHSKPVS